MPAVRSPVPELPIGKEIRSAVADLRLAERAAELDLAPEFPRREFRALGERRLLGLRTGAALGGRGLPLLAAAAALHELAYGAGTTFAKLALQPEFCGVLAEHGSALQQERSFRPLLEGRRLIGNHVTEPEAGSDAGALRTTARRDGESYVLAGTKSEAAFATDADEAIVYAKTSERGVSAFLVPQDLPGVERTQAPADLGERWMRRGTVRYAEVRVPATALLGDEGRAFDSLKSELTRERLLLAAIYLGVGRASFDETVAYVGEREAFGQPLAAQQAVGFPLVEDWERLDSGWLYLERALVRLESGEDVSGEAALAKRRATETALTAIDHAIQFHGGRGYSGGLPHERRFRDVRSGGIAHGPNEVMLRVAAGRLWPRRRPPG
ncbi:MAG TPA: acyl-CoA dehydrogenase family protein [Thermoplasmata archaeon]|nr:acyl-CoA dehydrogenase family protein [Thermoplasmata archaeon]